MEQQPDGRWHWEPPTCRPLCYECEAETDLYCYDFDGEAFWFCSPLCARRYAKRMGLDVDHISRTLSKPYNGASYGYSPYDMTDWECHDWGDNYGDSDDYDCCDDAEDYSDDDCEEL